MTKRKRKAGLILNISLAVILLGILILTVDAFAELEAEQKAHPPQSGMEYLGEAIVMGFICMLFMIWTISALSLYADLRYFLLRTEKTALETVFHTLTTVTAVVTVGSSVLYTRAPIMGDITLISAVAWLALRVIFAFVKFFVACAAEGREAHE